MPTAAAKAEIQMKAGGANKFREVSRRLRKAGRGDLQRELTKAVRKEGAPALAAVKAAWLGVQVESLDPDRGGTARPDTSTGLRRRVARATRMRVRQNGITIVVEGRRVDPEYPTLATYLNGFPRRRPWRHPVFGTGKRGSWQGAWAAQRGQEVFWPTLNEFRPQWRRGIEGATNRFVAELDRGL
ncbi:MAG TPA: hypothetical protein VF061_01800 [Gemmatimonadales bacterium]